MNSNIVIRDQAETLGLVETNSDIMVFQDSRQVALARPFVGANWVYRLEDILNPGMEYEVPLGASFDLTTYGSILRGIHILRTA